MLSYLIFQADRHTRYLKKLIGVLQDADYNGYVSVEDFSNEKYTYTELKENLEFLRLASTR